MTAKTLRGWLLAGWLLAAVPGSAQNRLPVDQSAHNLTPSGVQGANVCLYCHATHNAVTSPTRGLWSLAPSTSDYRLYTSSTSQSGTTSLATDSPSRMCMSCHDGTVAAGSTYTTPPPLTATRQLATSTGSGIDLASSHPLGFDTWQTDPSLRSELFTSTPRQTANPEVKLRNGKIECTTCHEPHIPNIDPTRSTKFLAVNNANGTLCQACHDINNPPPNVLSGWPASAHAGSAATDGAAVGGYGSVAESACLSCHTSHGSGSERLLRGVEENACFTCHARTASTARWAQVWLGYDDASKYMHPVTATGHRPGENLMDPSTPRHAECWDCHNTHAAKPTVPVTAPAIQGSLTQASGISKDGTPVTAANQYEVCFKCHGDSPNKPQTTGYAKFGYTPTRQVDSHNVRLDLNSTFARHNVVSARRGWSSPAYRSNMLNLDGSTGRDLTSGFLYCTDCHNGNTAQSSGGTGPNGPHLSAFEHLLERRYDMNRPAAAPNTPVSSLNIPPDGGDRLTGPFALCNKCHDIQKLLSTGDTVFRRHALHVVEGGISCSVCHAPHGVQGNDPSRHGYSINLDVTIVGPDPNSQRLEINTATKTCYVSCHFSNESQVHSGTHY